MVHVRGSSCLEISTDNSHWTLVFFPSFFNALAPPAGTVSSIRKSEMNLIYKTVCRRKMIQLKRQNPSWFLAALQDFGAARREL